MEPDAPGTSEVVPVSNGERHNLATPSTDLVGRQDELTQVAGLLASECLVTLVGAPGLGKTRLAIQSAFDPVDAMPDGVFFVDLSLVTQPHLVLNAVGVALGLREQAGQSFRQTLSDHLGPKNLLMVLDNCEHVLHACADLVCLLQRECPGLHILATSREALGVVGELAWTVPPLQSPEGESPSDVADNDAARLFLARTDPPLTLTDENAPHVARICRGLDGIPLAIELAAGRVGELTLSQIEAGLADRFQLLRSDRGAVPERQRSFFAALEWSYDLLSETERLVLRRLGVFAGPFTSAAAADVCSFDRIGIDGVASVIDRLERRSLVVGVEGDEGPVHRLHESVRQFASAKCVRTGELDEVHRSHLRWCAERASLADIGPAGPRQSEMLALLATIRADVRSALDWAADADPITGLALAGHLTRYWISQSSLDEGRVCLTRALETTDPDTEGRARALWGRGLIACLLGDYATVGPAVEEGIARAQAEEDGGVLARLLSLIGVTRIFIDPPAAIDVLGDAIALARQHDEVVTLVESLAMQGFAWALSGDLDEASRSLAESLSWGEGLAGQSLVMGLIGFGHVQLHQGAVTSARTHLDEGLELARREDNFIWVALALTYLSELEAILGDHERARHQAAEAVAVARRTGAPPVIGLALAMAGEIELVAGDPDASVALLDEALVLSDSGERGGVRSRALVGRGRAHLDLDELAQAEHVLGEAVTLAEETSNGVAQGAAHAQRGRLAQVRGDDAGALAAYREALANRYRSGDRIALPASLEAVAGETARGGDVVRALRLVTAAQGRRQKMGVPPTAEDQAHRDLVRARAAEAMGPEAQTRALVGTDLEGEALITYACAGPRPCESRTGPSAPGRTS